MFDTGGVAVGGGWRESHVEGIGTINNIAILLGSDAFVHDSTLSLLDSSAEDSCRKNPVSTTCQITAACREPSPKEAQ